VHATELARELGAPRVLVPLAPGVTSALGLLMADFRYDFSTTYLGSLSDSEPERINSVYADLESHALAQMAQDGLGDDILLTRTAEVRYRRQGFELDVPVPSGLLDGAALGEVGEAFHGLHTRLYGYAMRGEDLVLVNA